MRKLLVLLSTLALVGLAHAQQRAPARSGTVDRDPLGILDNPVVQKDLKLSEGQLKQVREAVQKYTAFDKQLAEQRRAGTLSPPDFQQQLFQSWSERNAAVAKILNAEQAKRFQQIQRQYAGFTRPEVAADLGLTEQQLREMRDVRDKFLRRYREVTRGAGAARFTDKKVQEQLRAINKERDQVLLKMLTPAQLKKWQELTGPSLPIRD